MAQSCVFCEIIAGRSPVSIVHEDDRSLCFMTLRPTRPGECIVIPRDHIDHFVDIPKDLTTHLALVTQLIGRALQEELSPRRVGMIVHGFGVPHAHFILVPQHHEHDITSGRFAAVEGGEIVFRHRRLPELPREELDRHAERLRARIASHAGAT
jgi:histidine triad (HIT) family protein